MPNYVATYLISNREISLNTDGTQTLANMVGKQAYIQINRTNGSPSVIIDIAKYMLLKSNLDQTLTLATLAGTLTDLQIDAYSTTIIPMKNPLTDGFHDRIDVYDAITAPDVDVAWTSIGTPGIRNDIYQKEAMHDLVISSRHRDFSNSLVTVNGVFHKTYLYNRELYVQDGFFNIKNQGKMLVGICDTSTVGGHTVLPIHINNIDASNHHPHHGVTLTFPHLDLTGKTLLLVLNGYLHAFDDTYKIINTNRIQIDTCKIDLINEFLHNPNTIYTKVGVAEAVFEDRLDTHRNAPKTVYDKIMWYLWNTYPEAREVTTTPANLIAFDPPLIPDPIPVADAITYYLTNTYPWARSATITPTNIMVYTRHQNSCRYAPTTEDDIYAYLLSYSRDCAPLLTQIIDFEWTTKYKKLTNVVGTIPARKFAEPAFIYNLLLSHNTFFVVINNPNIYCRNYSLFRTQIPAQYVHYGKDTPRGALSYNMQETLPYILYSDSRRYQHNVSLGFDNSYSDAYKTMLNPGAFPSPRYDLKTNVMRATHIRELYSS